MTSRDWLESVQYPWFTLDGPMIYSCPLPISPSFLISGPSSSTTYHQSQNTRLFPYLVGCICPSLLPRWKFSVSLKQKQGQVFIEESKCCWETNPPCRHLSVYPSLSSRCCFQLLCFHCFFNDESSKLSSWQPIPYLWLKSVYPGWECILSFCPL